MYFFQYWYLSMVISCLNNVENKKYMFLLLDANKKGKYIQCVYPLNLSPINFWIKKNKLSQLKNFYSV